MTASSINRLTDQYPSCLDSNSSGDNITGIGTDDDCYLSSCDQYKVEIAITLSLVVGIVMVSIRGGAGVGKGRGWALEGEGLVMYCMHAPVSYNTSK